MIVAALVHCTLFRISTYRTGNVLQDHEASFPARGHLSDAYDLGSVVDDWLVILGSPKISATMTQSCFLRRHAA